MKIKDRKVIKIKFEYDTCGQLHLLIMCPSLKLKLRSCGKYEKIT